MKIFLKRFFYLLERNERIKLALLFVLMLLASFLEVFGISLIPAFMIAVADPDLIFNLRYVGDLLNKLNIDTSRQLAVVTAIILISVFIFKNLYITYYKLLKIKFVNRNLIKLQKRLLEAYLSSPYTFLLNKNSADLLRNVNSEVSRVVNGTVMPILEISLQMVMFLLIFGGLLFFEPLITVITVIVMGFGGLMFLKYTEIKTQEVGVESRRASGGMNKVILQALGGFKDARILNREVSFLEQYYQYALKFIKASTYKSVIKELPKPIIETLLVTGIMIITLIMLYEDRSFEEMITILTIFGVAAIKLMPVFNSVINQISTVRYSTYSVESIYNDLKYLENIIVKDDLKINNFSKIEFKKEIKFENVYFRYPKSETYVLNDLNLTLKKGSVVAFIGSSGAGKTTLVDVLLGLLEPERGVIKVDGKDISENIRGWMKNIGYIQQSNYLLDARLYENIAFGVPEKEIDKDKLYNSIAAAQLDDLIQQLPKGLRTKTGERGVKFSGGQQQRIAIARAIYNNPQILIMDEATSALDNLTEKYVIDAIERLRGDRTIIMIAHRLTTVKNCDQIYMMEEGRIVAQGTYDELLGRSEEFRKMSLVE